MCPNKYNGFEIVLYLRERFFDTIFIWVKQRMTTILQSWDLKKFGSCKIFAKK